MKFTKGLLFCIALTPAQALASGECPLVEGTIVESLITSEYLIDALSSVPRERDEFQTSSDYNAMVREALGAAAEPNIFEVHTIDRSHISYNADEQRIEIGPGHFESTSDFDEFSLGGFFNITVSDERFWWVHLIVGLAENEVFIDQYTASNAFGVTMQVDVFNRMSVSVHGGIYEGDSTIPTLSFAPDLFVESDFDMMRPVITIPMEAEVARSEVPRLRAVVALTGLGGEVFVGNTSFEPTINRPEQISSTNFLFTSEVLCGGFIDSNARVLKVVPRLDEPEPYFR